MEQQNHPWSLLSVPKWNSIPSVLVDIFNTRKAPVAILTLVMRISEEVTAFYRIEARFLLSL